MYPLPNLPKLRRGEGEHSDFSNRMLCRDGHVRLSLTAYSTLSSNKTGSAAWLVPTGALTGAAWGRFASQRSRPLGEYNRACSSVG